MDKITGRRRKGLSRSVLKVMGLFTGTQAISILCSIIKMKLVAIWLHATGIGLFGIFNSTSETISCLTDMGLRQSAVRDVARSAGNLPRLATVAAVLRKWSVFSGLLGATVLLALSPFLASWFMDSAKQWWQFALLSVSLFINALVNGEFAIMQGTRLLKGIARASVGGSVTGLLLSIPLYRYLGEVSVILSIVLYAMVTLIWVRIYMNRDIPARKVGCTDLMKEGKGFIRLGICMAIAAFSTNMLNLLFLGYLQEAASPEEVGYYQSGATVIIRYAGLIFSAVGLEFYPRLAANIANRRRCETFVSHEILLLILVLVPMILGFYTLRDEVVRILYSEEFLIIIPFLSWAMLSLPFKALSWGMAYEVVASGNGRLFLIMEVTDGLLGFLILIGGYHFGSLEGVGAGFVLWYICYTLLTGFIFRTRYRMKVRGRVLGIALCGIIVCIGGLVVKTYLPGWWIWVYSILFSSVSLVMLRRLWRR